MNAVGLRHGCRLAFALVGLLGGVAVLVPTLAHANPGDLDGSFGRGGIAWIHDRPGTVSQVAAAPDGRILVAATLGSENPRTIVARFGSNGEADRTFGFEGTNFLDAIPGQSGLKPIGILPDGRAYLAAVTSVAPDSSVLVRLTADGQLDSTFAGDGVREISAQVKGIAAKPNGEIFILAEKAPRGGFVIRLNAAGEVDPSFGSAGAAQLPAGHHGQDIAIDKQARLVVVAGGTDAPVSVIRLLPDGQADPEFGDNGVAYGPCVVGCEGWTSDGFRIAPLSSGGVAAYGSFHQLNIRPAALPSAFVLTELGQFVTELATESFGEGFAVDAEDRVYFGGATRINDSGDRGSTHLERFDASGPDLGFGDGGNSVLNPSQDVDRITSLAVQSDGSVIAGTGLGSRAAVLRFVSLPGRPDRDGDEVGDSADACRIVPGRERRGCPVYRSPNISLKFKRTQGRFVGIISSERHVCEPTGDLPLIVRKRAGPDDVIAEAHLIEPSRAGVRFELETSVPVGRYYARAERRFKPLAGFCASGRSRAVRVRQRWPG